MNDLWNKFLEWNHTPSWIKTLVDHNRYTTLALLIIGAGVVFVLSGCDLVTTTSPVTGQKIPEAVLENQYTAWQTDFQARQTALINEGNTKAKEFNAAFNDIQLKKSYANTFIQQMQNLPAVAGVFAGPWGWLASLGLSIIVGGLKLDNSRKDQVIATTITSSTSEIPQTTTETPATILPPPTLEGAPGYHSV
jgi:hypothetical protein